ncbi:MAG: nucleotide sugar dehydrogenase [Flavobacteriales bacterium]|nr:nucleotide sugar dehydrogenase [Flavobacteriales bacterium]
MKNKIAVIGLGYVGLPLATEFAKQYKVVGYDIDQSRIKELLNYKDKTGEINLVDFRKVLKTKQNEFLAADKGLFLSDNHEDIAHSNIYIVTVPTPINDKKQPDLSHLLAASKMISQVLQKGDIVIYESTVYPGCTQEDCVPVLEKGSGLKYNQDFFCGYSPERISPGEKKNTLTKIKKVTSGSNEATAKKVDDIYKTIIEAGTHLAPSIKVAEASKSIENAQRDLNISFVNELAFIFDKMNIDTHEVLEAAGTKWNFLPFSPGLVGGHCISVDPYYLTYKSEKLGYKPSVILSGRNVNDQMGAFVASKVVKLMLNKDIEVKGAEVLILGITFKENCPDIRNTKILDVYNELISYGTKVDVYDSVAKKDEVRKELNIDLIEDYTHKKYAAIILAVAHEGFQTIDFQTFKSDSSIIFDAKSFINTKYIDGRL